jgi:opacity protein-like surface antigen
MKPFLVATLAIATLAGASAASAQPYGGPRGGYEIGYSSGGYDRYDRRTDFRDINGRQQALRHRLDRGLDSGRLTRREAEALRFELRDISRMERQFRASQGLSPREVAILDVRLERLERRMHAEIRDDQRYGYGYGYGDRGYGDRRH